MNISTSISIFSTSILIFSTSIWIFLFQYAVSLEVVQNSTLIWAVNTAEAVSRKLERFCRAVFNELMKYQVFCYFGNNNMARLAKNTSKPYIDTNKIAKKHGLCFCIICISICSIPIAVYDTHCTHLFHQLICFFRPLEAGICPGITRTRNFCEFHTRARNFWVLQDFHTRTRIFCEFWNFGEFCATFIPVPETSVSSVRPCHNTRGTGTTFVYLPGTSVSSARLPYRYPELLWVL